MLFRSGRFTDAVHSFEQRAQSGGRANTSSVVWAYALLRMDRVSSALPMLRMHYEAALRESATRYATRERAGMYAYALWRAGQTAQARQLFATALPGLLAARQGRRAAERADLLQDTVCNWIIEGYLESLAPLAASGNARAIAEMFRVADVARSSGVQRALAMAGSREIGRAHV